MADKHIRGRLERLWQRLRSSKGAVATETLATVALVAALGAGGFAATSTEEGDSVTDAVISTVLTTAANSDAWYMNQGWATIVTDGNGNVLYANGNPAGFTTLEAAFSNLGKYTYSNGTAFDGSYVFRMLVNDYTLSSSITAKGDYKVTLTTDPEVGAACTITKAAGIADSTMIRTELNELWLANITMDGGFDINDSGARDAVSDASYGGLVNMSKDDTTLVVDTGTTLKNGAARRGGAVYASQKSTIYLLRGAVLTGNYAAEDGGAICAGQEMTVVSIGATFENNESGYAGGGAINLSSNKNEGKKDSANQIIEKKPNSLAIMDSVFKNNASNGAGGAIRACENSMVAVTGSTFEKNTSTVTKYLDEKNAEKYAGEGGAIAVLSDADKTVTVNNEPKTLNNKSTLSISGSTFKGNKVDNGIGHDGVHGGGAVKIGGYGTLTIGGDKETVFGGSKEEDGNSAVNGGAIIVEPGASATISNATMQNSSASGFGGAIYLNSNTASGKLASVDLTDVKVLDSSATSGGALFLTSGSSAVIAGSTRIEKGSATADGGGAYVAQGAKATLQDTASVQSCKAGGNGGGVYSLGKFTMKDSSLISSSSANASGGGVYESVGVLQMLGVSSIAQCESGQHGGGVYVEGGATFNAKGEDGNVSISSCRTYLNGAGICLSDWLVKATLENCSISGCTSAANSGGGIFIWADALSMKNGSIVDCYAPNIGGAVCSNRGLATVRFEGCTMTGNAAGNVGGAVWTVDDGVVDVVGGTYSGNKSVNGGAFDANNVGAKLNFSGDVRVYDNLNDAGKQCNVYLNQNSTTVLNIASDGIAETARIGVFIDPVQYEGHGDEGKPFGSFAAGANACLYNVINDRNGLTGTAHDAADGTIYWEDLRVPILVEKVWDASVPDEEKELNETISFTVNGVANGGDHVVDTYPAGIGSAADFTLTANDAYVVGGERVEWAKVMFVPRYADVLTREEYSSYELSENALSGYAERGEWLTSYNSASADLWVDVPEGDSQIAYLSLSSENGASAKSFAAGSVLSFTYHDDAGVAYRSSVTLGQSATVGADERYVELVVPKGANLGAIAKPTSEEVPFDQASFLSTLPNDISPEQRISGVKTLQVLVPGERAYTVTNAYKLNTKAFTVVKKWNDGADEVQGGDSRVENLEVSFELYQVGLKAAEGVIGTNVELADSLKVEEPTVTINGEEMTLSDFYDTNPDGNTSISVPATSAFFFWDKEEGDGPGYYWIFQGYNNIDVNNMPDGPASQNSAVTNNRVKYTGTVWSTKVYDQLWNGHPRWNHMSRGDLIYDEDEHKYYVVTVPEGQDGQSEVIWVEHLNSRYKPIGNGSSSGAAPGEVAIDNYTNQPEAENLVNTLAAEGYVVKPYGSYTVRKSAGDSNDWFTVALNLPEGYGYYVVEMNVVQRNAIGADVDVTSNFTPTYVYSQDGRIATITNTFNSDSSKVILKKIDDATKGPLGGATFDILSAAGSTMTSGLASDETGVFYVGDFFLGTYYLKETRLPDGYGSGVKWFKMDVAATGTSITPLSGEPKFDSGGDIPPGPEGTVTISGSAMRGTAGSPIDVSGVTVKYGDTDVTGQASLAVYSDAQGNNKVADVVNGRVTIPNAGTYTLKATYNGKKSTNSITVTVGAAQYDVTISGSALSGIAGFPITVSGVTVKYGDTDVTGQAALAVYSDAQGSNKVADVSNGRVTVPAAGTYCLIATYNGKKSTSFISVNVDPNVTPETTIRISPEGPYKYGDKVFVDLWTNAGWVSMANVGWAFDITAGDATIQFYKNNDGITLKSSGTITLTAKIWSNDLYVNDTRVDYGTQGSITIDVEPLIEQSLNTESLSGRVGETGAIDVSYKKDAVESDPSSMLTYTCSNPLVAKCTNGSKTIEYLAAGDAEVSVFLNGKLLGTVPVHVSPMDVEATLDTTSLAGAVGDQGAIGVSDCKINDQAVQDPASQLTYEGYDASIVSVEGGSARVTYLAEGETTITVKFAGKVIGSVSVKVSSSSSGPQAGSEVSAAEKAMTSASIDKWKELQSADGVVYVAADISWDGSVYGLIYYNGSYYKCVQKGGSDMQTPLPATVSDSWMSAFSVTHLGDGVYRNYGWGECTWVKVS